MLVLNLAEIARKLYPDYFVYNRRVPGPFVSLVNSTAWNDALKTFIFLIYSYLIKSTLFVRSRHIAKTSRT